MNKLMENWRKFINEGKFTPYYIKFNPEGGVTEDVVKEVTTEILGIGEEFKADSEGAMITATEKGIKKLVDTFQKNKLQTSSIMKQDKKTPVVAA